MSSHGVVLDLLDDRYLNLQDVTGNVEPLPTLVPYEQYTRAMIVYRMEERQDFFVGRLHEFTDRTARLSGKELWTWFVQWEVETLPESSTEPATKRARLAAAPPAPKHVVVPPPQKGPAYTICERRTLRAELFEEDDILRILIDIVQVDSKLVPNYVEFLYQLIDFYEGDGKALKAAVRMEIPSLWMFEYHPLPIYDKTSSDAAETIGEKLTRKKPDISAFEAMTEESERLQYREPRFGLQPPVDPKNEPLPPLINIPKDEGKRNKYYAACFKNRQRALWLLQEAGLSARQIANYKRLQDEHPKNTPEDVNGTGFVNYYREEPFAHEQYMLAERMQKIRHKQNEIAISNKLALEAHLAAATQAGSILGDGPPNRQVVVPPPMPFIRTHPIHSRATMALLQRLAAIRQRGVPAIPRMPEPILAMTKSKLFEHTTAKRPSQPAEIHPSHLPHWPWSAAATSEAGSETGDDFSSDSSESEVYSGDDIDPDERDDDDDDGMDGDTSPGQQDEINDADDNMDSDMRDDGESEDYEMDVDGRDDDDSDQDQDNDNPTDSQSVLSTLPAQTTLAQHPAPTAPDVSAFIQGLSLTQLNTLMPLFSEQAQQAVLQRTAALNAGYSATAPGTAFGSNPSGQTMTNSLLGGLPSGISSGAHPQTNASNGFVPPPRLNAQFGTQGLANFPNGNSLQAQQSYLPLQSYLGAAPQPGPLPAMTVTTAPASTVPTTQGLSSHGLTSNPQVPPALASTHFQQSMTSQAQSAHVYPPSVPASSHATPSNSAFPQSHPSGLAPPFQATPLSSGPQTNGFLSRSALGLGPASHTTPSVSPGFAPGAGALSSMSSQAPQPTLRFPLSNGPFPATPRQPLTQSAVRAAPPASLNLQPSTAGSNSQLPTIQHPKPSPGLMTPLANLTGSLSLSNPYTASPHGIPIQIYVPKIIMRAGTLPYEATDCLILGYTQPGTGVLKLTRAIFLPVGVWENTLRLVRINKMHVLESYAPPRSHPRYAAHRGTLTNPEQLDSPHKALHDRISLIHGFMANCVDREDELTKRWRASKGPLTETDRGAVWEGYGVYIDSGIEMGPEERKGAFVSAGVDGPLDDLLDEDARRRKKEIEEYLEEELGDGNEGGGDPMEE